METEQNSMLKITERLIRVSSDSPLDLNKELIWPEALPQNQWTMAPELISLYGTDYYNSLTEEQKMKLSFFELINLFSLVLHGERHLISGMTLWMYQPMFKHVTAYLHHFVDEENIHSAYFGKFCIKYAGKVYPDTNERALPGDFEIGQEEFLFFAKLLFFEESFDRYNVVMSRDQNLPEIVRNINRCHHIDESRHLAFGRTFLKELFAQHSPSWAPETLTSIRLHLNDFFETSWQDLYNFRVYRDAGLPGDHIAIRDSALASDVGKANFRKLIAGPVKFFLDSGILLQEPKLASEKLSN